MSGVDWSSWFDTPDDVRTWVDVAEDEGLSLRTVMFPDLLFCDARVDPSRTDLVEEFQRNPLGPYSPDLQVLLFTLRTQDEGGRYVLQTRGPGRWAVGSVVGRGTPVTDPLGREFGALAEAEWAVFALRWRDHTGEVVDPMLEELA